MISARIGFGAKLLAALLVAVLLAQGVMLLLPNQSNTALAASTQRTLRKGCTGDDVKQLQVRLSSLGYMSSSLTTGYFGSITFDAVKRFQRDSKITVDGIAGKQTFAALDIAAPVTEGGSSSGGTSPTENNQEGGRYTYKYQSVQVVLKKGSSDDHVADMQTALKQRGYLADTIDGIFGNNTHNAALAF